MENCRQNHIHIVRRANTAKVPSPAKRKTLKNISNETSSVPMTSRVIAELFKPERDKTLAYHLDGDTSMYTEVALSRRLAMKQEPLVMESIEDFMNIYQTDGDGLIPKREYQRVYMKLCSVLRPDLTAIEKKKLIDEDWQKDTKGFPKMTRHMLFDCLYELCDIWCPNIEAEEYKCFFNQLKFRITYEGHIGVSPYDILK